MGSGMRVVGMLRGLALAGGALAGGVPAGGVLAGAALFGGGLAGGVLTGSALAQQPPADANALARSLANPLARITTISSELRLAAGQGQGRHGLVNQFTVIKPFELPQSWAVITRTNLPISITQYSREYVGLADIAFGAFLVTPPRSNLYAGVGVTSSLPAATRAGLGSRNWEAGPAAAFGYQDGAISTGLLLGQRWTLGGPAGVTRTTRSVLQGQFSFGLGDGWNTGVSTDTRYDWEAKGRFRWTVPVTFSLGRVLTFSDDRAVQIGGLVTHYALTGGPQRAVWEVGLNLGAVVSNGFLFR